MQEDLKELKLKAKEKVLKTQILCSFGLLYKNEKNEQQKESGADSIPI